jgi:hypothetical protein
VLIAGDYPEAKDVVFALARDMGSTPWIRSTPSARDLEKLVNVMLFLRPGRRPARSDGVGSGRACRRFQRSRLSQATAAG